MLHLVWLYVVCCSRVSTVYMTSGHPHVEAIQELVHHDSSDNPAGLTATNQDLCSIIL